MRKIKRTAICITISDSDDEYIPLESDALRGNGDAVVNKQTYKAPPAPKRKCTTKSDVLQTPSARSSNLPSVSHVSEPATTSSYNPTRNNGWTLTELLSERELIDHNVARNIINLLENENTIPFICRYRRDLIDNLSPDRLRDIRNTYMEIVDLCKQSTKIIAKLEKDKVANENIRREIMCAKSLEELEFLYAPYKASKETSRVARAISLGLEAYANQILFGEPPKINLGEIVAQLNSSEMSTARQVENEICHIVISNIMKNTTILEEFRRLQKKHKIFLKCSKAKEKASEDMNTRKTREKECSKFEQYFDFNVDVKALKSYHILAINRGEAKGFLSVKLPIPEKFKIDLKSFAWNVYMTSGIRYELRKQIFEKSYEKCLTERFQPLFGRRVRAELNEMAMRAANNVFAKNLKQLLLTSPLKGERILGIDPGFFNGCKLALISEAGNVLETGVIYPHKSGSNSDAAAQSLLKMLTRNNCKIIALGNGTACKETELWLSNLFESGILSSSNIKYSIVWENGASVYSCSELAKQEFPNMDINEISAVSIARRLNDPLSEYVKIEPKHLGVGMYQHDVNQKKLQEILNGVLSECVSFVGVDVNTASLSVLRNIAGLTEKRARNLIQHRSAKGPFRSRKDILSVKCIGRRTFTQCAGFLRIEPGSAGGEIVNLLDCTCIHPESYTIAESIIEMCDLKLKDIGTDKFIERIRSFIKNFDMQEAVNKFEVPKERIDVILEALQRRLFYDYRTELNTKPIFRRGVTRLEDVYMGQSLMGVVRNATDFGAFVDVGLETSGLIHKNNMSSKQLIIGDRVKTTVIKLDVHRKRVGLQLNEVVSVKSENIDKL